MKCWIQACFCVSDCNERFGEMSCVRMGKTLGDGLSELLCERLAEMLLCPRFGESLNPNFPSSMLQKAARPCFCRIK